MFVKIEKAYKELLELQSLVRAMPHAKQLAYEEVNTLDKKTVDKLHEIEMLTLSDEEMIQAGYDLQEYKRERRKMFYIQDTITPFVEDDLIEKIDELVLHLGLALQDYKDVVEKFDSLVYQYRDGEKKGQTIVKSYEENWSEPVTSELMKSLGRDEVGK